MPEFDPVNTAADPTRVPARMLGRTDRAVPAIWWRLDGRGIDAAVQSLLGGIARSETAWFVAPADLPVDAIARWKPALSALPRPARVVLGIDSADLNTRAMKPVYDRLDALDGVQCEALLLESISLSEVKAGRPFHRFARLRDEGRATHCIATADDFASAEWMIEHTPAHGILATFGLEDPTLRHRVIDAAKELGTAIIARRAPRAIWLPPEPIAASASISFALSHPSVAAVVEDFPANAGALQDCLAAAAQPMAEESAAGWWNGFQQQIPAPAKPKSGHPPEFGA